MKREREREREKKREEIISFCLMVHRFGRRNGEQWTSSLVFKKTNIFFSPQREARFLK